MKELTLETMIAVFEEIFGTLLFWAMVAAAIAITLAFLWVLLRDRGLESRPLVWSAVLAPVGAVAAVWFVQWVTASGLADLGGPIDWIVLLAIAVAGGGGLMLLCYTAQALIRGRRAG
ncbi:MAG: DUF5368 family protein [Rhodobacteraceae bacterium]|jgi:hypothetical protein|nr:DUF5368 family protein [Paracoccaceae bacterium]